MLTVTIRTVILYVLVIAAVRIMGKRTIGELQPAELVITLMISDLAAVPMQEVGIPLLTGVLPIAMLVVLEIFMSGLMLRSARFARVICGRPVAVIADGKIQQDALRRLRMTNADLFESLRKQSVFDIASVRWAVVEPDGSLSVLQKAECLPVSAGSAGVDTTGEQMSVLLVSDGVIEEHSMSLIGWDEQRIEDTLRREGLQPEEVFIMTGSSDGSFTIIKKE